MILNVLIIGLACVGAGTATVMAGAAARKLGSLWQRPTPEMQCLACGCKGLMGVLAPGKYCCAPCREEIWAEVEGRALPKPWQTPEAERQRKISLVTHAELTRRLAVTVQRQISAADKIAASQARWLESSPGRFREVDCRPKDIPRIYPAPTDRQQAALDAIVRNVWGEEEPEFVPLAQALKE